ncbi:uncharacterized protein BO95DRAFT_441735 [Aspergillus brunneoviolaceus CBS 621.78]|uniref:Uncharacterized protein n=1 Tax=Aspergillus brunneoviolaceus CBS 621.78 TaxID=1450534 RepID=A0ACD1GCC7_9EURO|nr:hypothetical protein BO95DRAFT_441735 [Aspergillus brunneoviolaceus CBS 621.78]RAH46818.1 hypothetical protein BO95DRAFT_441735 [Aspergillus brunneoviolaceus CBS 621.78]
MVTAAIACSSLIGFRVLQLPSDPSNENEIKKKKTPQLIGRNNQTQHGNRLSFLKWRNAPLRSRAEERWYVY